MLIANDCQHKREVMMSKTILTLLTACLTVTSQYSFANNKPADDSCGRIIAGLHPSITWGDNVARVMKIDGKTQFDSRTRFKLPPGKHSIEFSNVYLNASKTFEITIEKDTNYYLQWVFDYTSNKTDKNIKMDTPYSGPFVFKKKAEKCEL